jgi:glycosyltransferase involved in cell wall biosynthesis
MRILHVLNHRELYNGMVTAAVDLACAQADMDHTVALCSGPGDFDNVLAEKRVQTFDLGAYAKGAKFFTALAGVHTAIRQFRPDIVHAHMVAAAILAWPICKVAGIPFVTCVQNSFSNYASLMRIGDRVITGAQVVALNMQRRGVPKARLRPILNGTLGSARQDRMLWESSQERALSGLTIRKPAIVTACGLHARKGVPDLIVAFKAARAVMPDINLYIFGGGPDEDAYKALALADGPSNIVFCGQTPVLRPFLEQADIFVLASLADPAPLVICEAREAGLAVIATDVDGIPELLAYGEAGLLVKPGAPAEITEKILMLLSDPGQLAAWKAKSQHDIARLNVGRVARETVDVYRELVVSS